MSNLAETLRMFADLPQKSLDDFLGRTQLMYAPRGQQIYKETEIADKLTFIESGSLRSYYFKENKDVTISFSLTGEFVTSMSSFITQCPSYENIETLEDSTVLQISHQDLMELLASDRHLEHVYRLMLEQYYIKVEEQLIFSKFKTARDRYKDLLEHHPHIIRIASVGHIASFLDMSIETLSRIRSSL